MREGKGAGLRIGLLSILTWGGGREGRVASSWGEGAGKAWLGSGPALGRGAGPGQTLLEPTEGGRVGGTRAGQVPWGGPCICSPLCCILSLSSFRPFVADSEEEEEDEGSSALLRHRPQTTEEKVRAGDPWGGGVSMGPGPVPLWVGSNSMPLLWGLWGASSGQMRP